LIGTPGLGLREQLDDAEYVFIEITSNKLIDLVQDKEADFSGGHACYSSSTSKNVMYAGRCSHHHLCRILSDSADII
jgi:hypothetical protein